MKSARKSATPLVFSWSISVFRTSSFCTIPRSNSRSSILYVSPLITNRITIVDQIRNHFAQLSIYGYISCKILCTIVINLCLLCLHYQQHHLQVMVVDLALGLSPLYRPLSLGFVKQILVSVIQINHMSFIL